MKAALKGLACDEVNVENYMPDESDCFNIRLVARIGPSGQESSDYFEFYVCTPEWIKRNNYCPFWGRNHLVVNEFDIVTIRNMIELLISNAEAENWGDLAKQLAAYMSWEYDGYKS
ncbi:hypothetical protein JOD97_000006 [Duganella sp. 1411]|jgi:hypothetical protein|uniref:Imm8 family immunity protein n=1 Tax=Duganella sp. 1411 TaxID=2806572 RepID=UPI001AE546A7|nr:Imm8 family immunity protein [Duganella sp. 1411]MBP1201992.1 hypothetical protein [Duganella sp. 1411]